jgi:uncharacterized protein (TIGR03663 family)
MTSTSETPEKSSPAANDWLSRPVNLYWQWDWEKTIYLLIIIFTIVSRFVALGDRVVSHDESLHTQYSYQYYDGQGFSHTPLMHGPFLFHATAFSYWLFGHNDYTARIPAAIFGLLLVLSPYFLRDWLGKRGALFASFGFAVSPYIWYYSRYIREDIFSLVWMMIMVIGIWHYLTYGKNGRCGGLPRVWRCSLPPKRFLLSMWLFLAVLWSCAC